MYLETNMDGDIKENLIEIIEDVVNESHKILDNKNNDLISKGD